jgi:hypothetical protein
MGKSDKILQGMLNQVQDTNVHYINTTVLANIKIVE